MVADDAGEVFGEAGVIGAGADELDGGGGPELLHPGFAPDPFALGVGLQDRDRHDGAGTQMGVLLGQVPDPADVRDLVQDEQQRRVDPAAGRSPACSAATRTSLVRQETRAAAEVPPVTFFDSRYSVSA